MIGVSEGDIEIDVVIEYALKPMFIREQDISKIDEREEIITNILL